MHPEINDRLEEWTAYAESKELITELHAHDLFYICRKEAAHYHK